MGVLSLIYLGFLATSCTKPDPSTSEPPKTIPISIQNPQYGMGSGGTGSNWQMSNDANFKLKVMVQALDGAMKATLYKTYTFSKNYSGLSDSWCNENIEVPDKGYFVVQVTMDYSECTWQWASCSYPYTGSEKEYFKQFTYSSKPTSITCPMSNADINYQDCICQ